MVAAQQEPAPRERILASARRLFATKGFHQTAMAELAQDAQVSVGLIYRMFTGKEAIIGAIVEADGADRCADLQHVTDAIRTGSMTPRAALEQIILRAMSDKDEGFSFEILAEGSRNEGVGQVIGMMCDNYRQALRATAVSANPALAGSALEAAEEVLLACLFGLSHRTLSRPSLSREATARIGAEMLCAALLAPQPA